MAAKRTTKRAGAKPRRPARPRRAPQPLTPEQDARYSAMRTTGIDQKTISDTLADRGVPISRQSVGLVIRNNFVNDDVISVFCELTGTEREKLWPEPMFAPVALDNEAE